MKKMITAISCALLLSTSSITLAGEPFEAETQARQAFMQVLKFNIGILGDMAKGNRDYNPQLAETAANNIHSASLMDNGAMWPQGSDNTNAQLAGKTKALPETWTTYPKIVNKHKTWTDASAVLAANAGKGLSDLRNNLGAVGNSCKGCHDSFRAED